MWGGATEGIYQRMITACREPDRARGRADDRAHGGGERRRPRNPDRAAPSRARAEPRAADVLAYFDRPRANNGPTEAINGRLELIHLRFRNLTNYIA